MKAVQVFVLAYPAMLPASILRTWLVGRLALGYWPRPSLDDPKSIGLLVKMTYFFAIGLMAVGVPAFGAGVGYLLYRAYRDRDRRRTLLLQSGLSTVALITSILVLRQDPLGVVTWFMD